MTISILTANHVPSRHGLRTSDRILSISELNLVTPVNVRGGDLVLNRRLEIVVGVGFHSTERNNSVVHLSDEEVSGSCSYFSFGESSLNTPDTLGASVLPLSYVCISEVAMTMSTQSEDERIELPSDVAEVFRQVGNRDTPPETLQDGFTIIDDVLDDEEIRIEFDDMYQAEPTRHAVHIGDTIEYVPCVMDAMIVALSLETRPIEIQSQPPSGGEPVQFLVTDEDITVTPESAVVSFGITYEEADNTDVGEVKELLNEESTIPTTCSLINAFPNPKAYERWAVTVSNGAVMELSVEELIVAARQTAQRRYVIT